MKPTASQLALMHAVESALVSAVLTIGAALYQYITSHSLDIPGLLAFLGTAFLGAMFMVYKSVIANPALPQAESDTANEIKDFVGNEFAQFVNQHMGFLGDRLKAIEEAIANHSHTPLPAPSTLAQGGVIKPGTMAIVGDGTPPLVVPSFSGSTVTNVPVQPAPQPQAPMLNTFPTLTAVPKN